MTAVMTLSKNFELSVKMMKTAEDNDQSMARVLQS
jgi:flagellar basal-body rod protein FlgF